MAKLRRPMIERFLEKIIPEPNSGCWLWSGASISAGTCYGIIGRGGRKDGYELAHRLSYAIHKGPIPAGLELDHKCRVTLCVNPDHLESGHASGKRSTWDGWRSKVGPDSLLIA